MFWNLSIKHWTWPKFLRSWFLTDTILRTIKCFQNKNKIQFANWSIKTIHLKNIARRYFNHRVMPNLSSLPSFKNVQCPKSAQILARWPTLFSQGTLVQEYSFRMFIFDEYLWSWIYSNQIKSSFSSSFQQIKEEKIRSRTESHISTDVDVTPKITPRNFMSGLPSTPSYDPGSS